MEITNEKYWLDKFTALNQNPLPAWATRKMLEQRKRKLAIYQELAAEEHEAARIHSSKFRA